ncbi:WXG100 family type VII secretion target [Rhodococcus spelaei]|uniref:ESAT-6-like protein n=1 Tax=Rhodococcus spelaei TaxID=2546320 RepID=A0A541B973_9NOCA|nr:WXG100 family type VII secretion target [Rhodococcus spelaei]TQF68867.1 WXG100 family type VII secretion target [Rhodococcus spelaei]
MGDFKTTSEEMEIASQRVKDANEQIQGHIAAIRGQVDQLQGLWRGTAKGSFDGLMARWEASGKKLNDALMGISENIKTNGVRFSEAQDAHTTAINNAGGSLNL